MFKTTSSHKKYWQERKTDWIQEYFNTWDHPHRKMIIDHLKKMPNIQSLFEIGCASGPNLHLISQTFPNLAIGGVDINEEAIATARKLLPEKTILEARSGEDVFLSDKSISVTLTDMTLIYYGSRQIHKVMAEIKRITRQYAIFVEFHHKNILKRWGLRLATGYNAYNYQKLLSKYGFYDIEIEKIPEEMWPGGEPQKTFGYIITAKIV